ncbi:MAG: DUF1592 domain-containing protein [Myxococcota bacterium]
MGRRSTGTRARICWCGLLALSSACSGLVEENAVPSRHPPTPLDVTQPAVCDPAAARPLPARVWRLGEQQWIRSAAALLGLDNVTSELGEDPVGTAFSGEVAVLRVRDGETAALWRDGQALAERALREGSVTERYPCIESPDAACAETFVRGFGREAFRRPLRDHETTRYVELFELAEAELNEGAQAVIQAMLQSPHLVYRSELGPEGDRGIVELTPYELASSLSFFFLDSPPDAELTALADAGELTGDALSAQIVRLGDDPRWMEKKERFVRELLDLTHLSDVEKDTELYPGFADLQGSFQAELNGMIRNAFENGSANLDLIFNSRETIDDPALAEFYGGALGVERRGLLTRGAFLSAHSGIGITSPVTRGYVMRTRILCDTIPDPPPGANTGVPDPEPGMSQRDLIDSATATGSCAGCHSRMNDLGFAFGGYDAIGGLRDTDDFGVDLDLSGELSDTQDVDGEFANLDELLDRLRGSDQVAQCMSVQAFRFAAGQDASQSDTCTTIAMLEASGADVSFDAMLRAYAEADFFRQREVQ